MHLFLNYPKTVKEVLLKFSIYELDVDDIIYEGSIDKEKLLVLFSDRKGFLNGAIFEKSLVFYKLDSFFGGISITEPYNLQIGDIKVDISIASYGSEQKYIAYGIIKDKSIEKVMYTDKVLNEIEFKGSRIVYGSINEIQVLNGYTVYDKLGNNVKHIK